MPTYTFITDFRNNHYVGQQTANDLRFACYLWKDDVVAGGFIQHVNVEDFAGAFESNIDDLAPTPLDTVHNVWLFDILLGKYMLSVHIVQTDIADAKVEVRGAHLFG